MYTFDWIRAYGHMIGASPKTIQRMVDRADKDEVDLAQEPLWFIEGDGWRYSHQVSKTIRDEVHAWVAERGGRSDEFILTRDVYGAVEVEQTDPDGEYTTDSPRPRPAVTWQERLCMEQGWSDPGNITWAATFSLNFDPLGTTQERHGIIIQTVDSGVQVYISTNEGNGWTIGAPVVIAEY